ncbi:MAG: amidohydrolase family protein, partial [Pseudomonadota bacterium]
MRDDLPIIDAHHHFWDIERNYHPWLRDAPPISFRYGDYTALKRNYLKSDYDRDSASFNIAGTVYVEAEWDPTDPLGETRWVHEVAASSGLPTAMVAQAWLDRDDVEAVLDAQAAMPLVRSVRHKPRAAATPDHVEAGAPGSMGDPAWRRGFALLENYGLAFDLQTPWWHLSEAADLAEDFPTTQIVLNHAGLPADRSEDGLKGWRQAMTELSH